jgi:preprotein translocase subunit YajC
MFITPAYAQAAGAAQASPLSAISTVAPMILIFVAFYFLMIRPQQKRMKELQNSINAVKKGDQVVTGGGLIGKVTKVDETEVEVELAPNVRVRVIKGMLSEVRQPGAKPAND